MYDTSRISSTGLFEAFIGFVVEGDAVTPTQTQTIHIGSFHTLSESLAALQEANAECEYVAVPANWAKRMNALQAMKAANRITEHKDQNDSHGVPF